MMPIGEASIYSLGRGPRYLPGSSLSEAHSTSFRGGTAWDRAGLWPGYADPRNIKTPKPPPPRPYEYVREMKSLFGLGSAVGSEYVG